MGRFIDNQYFQGVILVDKPIGENSFASIAKLRRLLGIKRIGHCGTLDPFASGLLPICIGRATGAVNYMQNFGKSYRVEITFGARTNTQDCDGEVTDCINLLDRGWDIATLSDQARRCGEELVGDIEQEPPMFSAVKIAGKPLHYYARKGQEVERKRRRVQIYRADALNYDTWEIHCSKGTYIRSWVDTLGEKIGCFAHAKALRRMSCGPLSIEDSRCVDLEQLFEVFNGFDRDPVKMQMYLLEKGLVLSLAEVFKNYPQIALNKNLSRKLSHGQTITVPIDCIQTNSIDRDIIAVYHGQRLLAFAKISKVIDTQQIKVRAERVLLAADEV